MTDGSAMPAEIPESVVVAPSITMLPSDVAGRIVLTGSHGGLYTGRLAAARKVAGVVFHDAGGGLGAAGTGGWHSCIRSASQRLRSATSRHESAIPRTCFDAASSAPSMPMLPLAGFVSVTMWHGRLRCSTASPVHRRPALRCLPKIDS